MPLHDFICSICGTVHEELVEWDEYKVLCPQCQGTSERTYRSFNGIKHTAPDWMKSVLEVVDKDGGNHCQEFLKHPNRDNYQNWMKTEGLRPMEPGEPMKRKKVDKTPIRKAVKESFRKRNTISIREGANV